MLSQSLFQKSLMASFALHAAFWALLWASQLKLQSALPHLEIDLTKPFSLSGNPLLKPGGSPATLARTTPLVPAPVEKPAVAPKEWVLPASPDQPVEKPVEEAAGTRGPVGFGGDGEGGGVPLTRLPSLLNRNEMLKNLRRFYPEPERLAGREGEVLLDIHIGADGRVGRVEIIQSAGEAFSRAAERVAKEMRFSPAYVRETPVAVKIRQALYFRLED